MKHMSSKILIYWRIDLIYSFSICSRIIYFNVFFFIVFATINYFFHLDYILLIYALEYNLFEYIFFIVFAISFLPLKDEISGKRSRR